MSNSSRLTSIQESGIDGGTLRDIVTAQGRYQSWIAESLGVSPATVNQWISGVTAVPAGNAVRLAGLLGVSPEAILAASRASQVEFHVGRLRELGVELVSGVREAVHA